jgi:RNA polymerase-associated protein LEO1
MSSQALFEESSSDEEESPAADASAPKRNVIKEEEIEEGDTLMDVEEDKDTPSGNAAAAADDDDEDDDDDKEESAQPSSSDAAANNNSRLVIDEDDSDEGDEEFDDGGAIVGSSAPARKKPPPLKDSTEEMMQDGETPVPVKAASKPPQSATVLEADRPKKGESLHMIKLPNLLAIQPNAFDEETYDEKDEEEQYKGYMHNMVRWRYKRDGSSGELERDEDGKLVRESNTRLVKWNDGSVTLYIGNEAFDVQSVDSSSNGFAGLNGFVYLSQKATFSNEGEDKDAPGGTVLECMGPVASRFVAKPSSLQSDAHKSLTVAVRQRTIKKARIAEYVTQEDPEKLKEERIRYNEDAEKIQAKKKNSNYRYNNTASRTRTPGMNRRYLEDDDDNYDGVSIRALKKGVGNDDAMDDYGDESDGDDDGYDDTFRGRRSKRQQKKAVEEDEEEELVFDAESDEDDVTLIKAHKKKRPHQAVLDDDDDED